ncbi:hypothetical protein C8T65DRAFT_738425 [Cerioporus squamosus]|nr:hypothetical protein C8T65DRAFT_738425 [Cerioporus squamosus]
MGYPHYFSDTTPATGLADTTVPPSRRPPPTGRMSGTQKALYLTARAGQWVVAALNPIDWKLVDSPFSSIIQSYPFISGTDGAGIVEEVGADVTTLAKGDRIVFQGYFANELATFQQYCLVPAAITRRYVRVCFQFRLVQGKVSSLYGSGVQIPDNISFDEAASIPLGLATVVLALYNQT